jgi:hypothetical protein
MKMAKPMSTDRDEVLYSFHLSCPEPSAADIIEWADRYPEYADDIRAHAAVALDWAAHPEVEVTVDAADLARAHSRALNIIYGRAGTSPVAGEQAHGFFVLMDKAGTKISRIASEIDIARAVLADLFNGWILPPVGGRLSRALMERFGLDQAAFDREVTFALANPRMGEAKAQGAPQIVQRSYKDSVQSSGMTPERIRYWLEED